jgi:hypothetical protein
MQIYTLTQVKFTSLQKQTNNQENMKNSSFSKHWISESKVSDDS